MEHNKLYVDISIIIPCYNVEDYIEECLNSIINSPVLPKEILCIDDGSEDNSANIIKQMATQCHLIKYIKQKNQGVSSARNTGIKLATSSYIQFIDPDDIISPYLFQLFKDTYNLNNNIELFYFEHESFNIKDDIKFEQVKKEALTYFPSGASLFCCLNKNEKYPGASWKYIFCKKILSVEFKGRNHEDHLVTLNIIFAAQTTYYVQVPLYFYRKRVNSLTAFNKINKSYIAVFSDVINRCCVYVSNQNIPSEIKIQYSIFLRSSYLFHINIYYLNTNKPDIITTYTDLYIRLFIKNKHNKISNITYILRTTVKNKIPIRHCFTLIKAACNMRIIFLTQKINNLL